MEQQMYQCPKCGNTSYETDQFQATGKFAKIFDVQNKKIYHHQLHQLRLYGDLSNQTSTGWNVLDF